MQFSDTLSSVLCYFSLLIISTMVRYEKDPRIWRCSARNFPWSDTRCLLNSAPNTPTLPNFNRRKIPSIVAPKPRRAAPTAIYAYRSGLGPDYEIEHYQPPSSFGDQLSPPESVAAPAFRQMTETTHQSKSNAPATVFYPQYMQSALIPQPPRAQASSSQRRLPPAPPSPPPLGDWPRTNAMTQPLRSKRVPKPLMLVTPMSQTPSSVGASSPPSSSLPRSRPGGPRRRSDSGGDNRPPALDLSNISSFPEGNHR